MSAPPSPDSASAHPGAPSEAPAPWARTSRPAYSAFSGHTHLASGDLAHVALAVKRLAETDGRTTLLTIDNGSGRVVDLDLRGSDAEVLARLPQPAQDPMAPQTGEAEAPPAAPRGRGRPRLGVVAREITLLPRHWEWLARQPGGASVTLRKLVEAARRTGSERDLQRAAHDRTYQFMHAVGGDLPDYEEATRALFAHDMAAFTERLSAWPADLRAHALWLVGTAD